MLKVDQYEYIRTSHRVYGKKIKEIARETGHSKNTIKRILRGEYKGYKERDKQPFPVLEPYLAMIDEWLRSDKEAPKKQRHTAVRIYNRLKEEHGFQGAESTVRRCVREARLMQGLTGRQVFIPCDPEAGIEAEVDWGRCHAILGGEQTLLKYFCMRSKYSGKHFVRCYPCERQQALFDGHIQAFSFFQGVFPVLIYDNLTTAVEKILKGKNRELQKSYDKFRAYYNFSPLFCNAGQGHEKGGVEGIVGYARRNYMVPVPQADTLEHLNENLLIKCLSYGDHRIAGREQTVNELYEQEKNHLIALPEIPFSNLQTATGKIDKYSTILVDKNRYSVPTSYAYCKASIVLHVDRVEIFYGNKNIARHDRLFGNNKWSLKPEHYLELIQQRPQAFHSARPIRQWRNNWPSCLERLLELFIKKQGDTKGIKDFISVLILYKDHDAVEIEAAVEKALDANTGFSAAVKHLLINAHDPAPSFAPLENWEKLPPSDVSVYRQIGGGI
ncbi:MAG: IS21 family transposase [Deltaproteobacteria bacterium]|nr:IS21 family transposase [Deltaproteobacteria bacterium]